MKKLKLLLLMMLGICSITFSQNVGINNSTPAFPLDVVQSSGGYSFRLVNPSNTVGATVGILFTNNAAYGANSNNSASINAIRSINGGQHLAFATSPTSSFPVERVRIDSAGNMGISTGSLGVGILKPSYDIHIYRNNPSVGFYDDDDDHTSGVIEGDSANLSINAYRKSAFGSNTPGNLLLQVGIGGVLPLTAGNVGIGTTTPTEKLDVRGDIKLENTGTSSFSMVAGDASSAFLRVYKQSSATQVGYLAFHNSTEYSVWNGYGGTAYLTKDGYLGIENSSPDTRLHITSGQDAGLAGTANGFVMLGSATSSNLIFDNNEIMARNNGAVAPLTLQNDGGSVRIGNVAAPAGYVFAVNGKAICEELIVQLSGNWPDYVFKKDYRLKSFDELRKFISANHHLPNIPAAAELEKNGMEVGDMQKRMMEKIEELTLYVLQLEEKVSRLEKK